MKETNFDRFLKEQLADKHFAARFQRAGDAWEVAILLAALRKEVGLSQQELARKLKTSQQQISRLESTGYEGHSLSMLRRVADALDVKLRLVFERKQTPKSASVAETPGEYRVPKRSRKQASTRKGAADRG